MSPEMLPFFVLLASIIARNCEEIMVSHAETVEPVIGSQLEESSVLLEPADSVESPEPVAKVEPDGSADATNLTIPRNDTNPINCTPLGLDSDGAVPNKLVLLNGTALLLELTPAANKSNTTTIGDCVVVTFYSPYCEFCARTAPYINALPPAFPDVKFFAVDVVQSSQINMRYGLVAVPSVLLFHNGRAVAKFNDSLPTMLGLAGFITRHTGLSPERQLAPDESGPLSDVPLEYTDWVLVGAWIFTIVCCAGAFLRSTLCKRMTASVQNAWREAQHQHQD